MSNVGKPLAGQSVESGGRTMSGLGGRILDYDRFIEHQLIKARKQIKSLEVLTSLALLATGVTVYLLVMAVVDHWLVPAGLSPRGRWLAFAIFAIGVVAYISLAVVVPVVPWLAQHRWLIRWSRWAALPVLRRIHSYYAARTIEQADPRFKNSLLNFLELRRGSERLSPAVLEAVERQAATRLAQIEVENAISRDRLLQVLYVLLAAVAVGCLYTLLNPKSTFTAFGRVLFPASGIAPSTQTIITDIEPGNGRAFAGEPVEITARVRGVRPELLTLYYTTDSRQHLKRPLAMASIDGTSRYQVTVPPDSAQGVQESFEYYIQGGDAATAVYRMEVIVPPTAQVESITYDYPDYTGLEDRTVPSPEIDALEGTQVTVTAKANMPVARGKIDFDPDGATDLPLAVRSQQLQAQFPLQLGDDGGPLYHSYRILIETSDKQINPRPTLHTIRVRPDLPPQVSITQPGRDVQMPANGVLPITVEATDPDFGLGGVQLMFKYQPTPPTVVPLGEVQSLDRHFRDTYSLDLATLNVQSGDVVQYWAEARDNKLPQANHARTPEFQIRVVSPVSPEERERQLAAADDAATQVEQLSQEPPQQEPLEQPETPAADQPTGQEQPAEQRESSEDRDRSDELEADGTDDEQALSRIVEHMRQEDRSPPEEPEGSQQREDRSAQGAKQDQGSEEGQGDQAEPQQDQEQDQQPGLPSSPLGIGQSAGAGQGSGDQSGQNGSGESGGSDEQSQTSEGQGGEGRDQNSAGPGEKPAAEGDAHQPASAEGQGSQEGPRGQAAGQGRGSETRRAQAEKGSRGDTQGSPDAGGQGQAGEPGREQPPGTPGAVPSPQPRSGEEDDSADTVSPGERQSGPGDERGSERPASPSGEEPGAVPPASGPRQPIDDQDRKSSDGSAPSPSAEGASPASPERQFGAPPTASDPRQQPRPSQTQGGGTEGAQAGAGAENQGQPGLGEGDSQSGQSSAGSEGGSPDQAPGGAETGPQAGGDAMSPPQEQSGQGAGAQQAGGGQPSSAGGSEGQSSGDQSAPSSGDAGQSSGASGSSPSDGSGPGQGPAPSDAPSSPQTGGQPGGGQPGGGQPGAGQPGGGRGGPGDRSAQGEYVPGEERVPPGDAPDLDAARKAANLVLDRLESQLRRGEIDPELLKKLGWTQEELEAFLNRMQRRLDDTEENPELAETLRRILHRPSGAQRDAGTFTRRTSGVIDPGRLQPPPELRERVDAYTKSISRYRTPSADESR